MSVVLIYNPNDPVVPNRTTQLIKSANTPDYEGRPDALINPVIPQGVNLFQSKVSNGEVVAFDAADLQAIADAQAAAAAAAAAANLQSAKDYFDATDPTALLLRACVLVIIDGMNTLRAQHGLPAVTPAQFKNAVDAKIGA